MLQKILILCCLIFSGQGSAACAPNGLFGQLCTKSDECVTGTIIWKAHFKCYAAYGVCSENNNNVCAWEQSPELSACIQTIDNKIAAIDIYSD